MHESKEQALKVIKLRVCIPVCKYKAEPKNSEIENIENQAASVCEGLKLSDCPERSKRNARHFVKGTEMVETEKVR